LFEFIIIIIITWLLPCHKSASIITNAVKLSKLYLVVYMLLNNMNLSSVY